jgi:hypothetical protein
MPLQNVQSLVATESSTETSSPANALPAASETPMIASAKQRIATALRGDSGKVLVLGTSVIFEAIVMTRLQWT